MTDESQTGDLPSPGETEGGKIDPSRIPQEAQENPELRVPDKDATTTQAPETPRE